MRLGNTTTRVFLDSFPQNLRLFERPAVAAARRLPAAQAGDEPRQFPRVRVVTAAMFAPAWLRVVFYDVALFQFAKTKPAVKD